MGIAPDVMLKPTLVTVAAVVTLTACSAIRNASSPPEELDENGKINPCHNHKRNRQACGNAMFNAPGLNFLQLGDSAAVTREKMQGGLEGQVSHASLGSRAPVFRYRNGG